MSRVSLTASHLKALEVARAAIRATLTSKEHELDRRWSYANVELGGDMSVSVSGRLIGLPHLFEVQMRFTDAMACSLRVEVTEPRHRRITWVGDGHIHRNGHAGVGNMRMPFGPETD